MISFARPATRLSIQLLFWFLLFGGVGGFLLWLGFPQVVFWRSLFISFAISLLLTLNIYILFPRYLAQRHYTVYIISALGFAFALITAASLVEHVLLESPPPIRPGRHVLPERAAAFMFFPALFLKTVLLFSAVSISSLVEYIHLRQKSERLTAKIKADNIATELQFLKSQINPHFLLNTLNNIYGLSIRPGGDNSEAILQLSEMLRYVLYDCNKPQVPVDAEISYVRHYIALQQLKDEGRFNVRCRYPISTHGFSIAPMLLIPLVENAFKHSKIEDLKKGWINIELRIMEAQVLQLKVKNSLPTYNYQKDQQGGIGLKNVQRRLELLYPDAHELSVEKQASQYEVCLQVALSS